MRTTKSRWDAAEAAAFDDDLGLRVYTSRLLGLDPSLVLHGGGNTSVKGAVRTLLDEDVVDVLYVKGSGWNLETIEPAGFAPVRLDALLALSRLDALSDVEMARQLRLATLDPAAPAPSVEAILHAILPYRYVDHTHPDLLISVMNTPSGEARVREIYGDDVVVIPYVMPGFPLSRLCAAEFPRQVHEGTLGMVLMHHGLFTFGDTAREAYERTIELVGRAEDYLREHDALDLEPAAGPEPGAVRVDIADLRRAVSDAAGRPLLLTRSGDTAGSAYARRVDLARISQSGPATPDHVIRTKRVPLLGRDVATYATAYRGYVAEHQDRAPLPLTPLDPAPRVILDPELGLLAAGQSAAETGVILDIALHTAAIVERAESLEEWRALPPADVFDVEYWDLEQAKLRAAGPPRPFAGEVALVTGAASGIGRACCEAFLARGAAVVGLDLAATVDRVAPAPAYLGIRCDITDEDAVRDALETAGRAFGGLDMLVLNAGVFPSGTPIAALTLEDWSRTLRVNLDANVTLLREAHPLLGLASRGGRVVVNASKNVPAPGPGAAAYSASKAALTQLARVAALEWGADGIRVNVVHPNAVFDTGVWTDDVIADRADSYGLSVEEYRSNNVLRTEVTSRDVAELVAAMCGPAFARTTGAQVPVDGGNERVI